MVSLEEALCMSEDVLPIQAASPVITMNFKTRTMGLGIKEDSSQKDVH